LHKNAANFGELRAEGGPLVVFFSLQAMSQPQPITQEYSSCELLPSGKINFSFSSMCISSSAFKGPIPTVPIAHQPPPIPKDRVDIVAQPAKSDEPTSNLILPSPPAQSDSSSCPSV
jgi:hypothetical protein